jgi:hypothetical protein
MGFFDDFNRSTKSGNHMSPFGEAGLLFDPLAYIGGDKYKSFMRKTWEKPNEVVGKGVAKFNVFDRKINPMHKAIDKTQFGKDARNMVENKPGDSALAVIGSIFGGGALMSGMGGGGAGGSGGGMFGSSTGGGNLGIFSNGGQGGMGSVGTGNAGQLFGSTGINTGGVGGVGGTGAQGGLGQLGMQDWMKLGQDGQRLMGGQQQQDTGPKPYLYRGQIVWM